jgi:nucleoside-diphosphate-sugar epimerase
MRVIVIGATGHIGTWLIPRLVRAGHEVVAVSRGERAPYRHSPEWDSVDRVVLDRAFAERDGSFGKRIASLRADAVIDLICFEVESAVHLVDALRGQIQHFVHCGTLWVHGIPQSCPYDETAPREPFGEYGIRKAAIEKYLLGESQRQFPATILHPGHITGPGWNPINPQGNLNRDVFDRLARGDILELPDDGMARLQHVHTDDVAQAFELAVSLPEKSIGQSFHVAARNPVTMRSYAEMVAAWAGRDANLAFLPMEQWKRNRSERDVSLTLDHITHSPCASIEKAERVLGFRPRFTAVDAVRDALTHPLS